MKELKNPLPSQVQTGYHTSKAVHQATKHFDRAIQCSAQAVIDTNADGVEVQNVELGSFRRAIYRAMAALQCVEAAHLELSRDMVKKGYRTPNDEDFKEYGSGGTTR